MFSKIGQIFDKQNKDLRKKILFTFLALFIFKVGTSIVVPGIDKKDLFANVPGFLELVNVIGGGALQRFSIFALGVMPYITATIITQLLAFLDVIPYLKELTAGGQIGRNKLNMINRILGIGIAFVQGYVFSSAFIQNQTVLQNLEISLYLATGTAFLLWLGDQMTMKGIGNGISMLIMAGIVASLPNMFLQAYLSLVKAGSTQTMAIGITAFAIFVLIYLIVIVGVVFVQLAERRIPIQYANKSNKTSFSNKSYMPFKLNSASVMPVIFASAIISIPMMLTNVFKAEWVKLFIDKWLSMSSPTGFLIYIGLIFFFSFLYVNLQIKPKELSDNLRKGGGFIPGVRPGSETEEYVSTVLNRITFVGAFFLASLVAIPRLFELFSNLPTSVTVGGTSILIVVGVALETYKSLESQLLSREYSKRRGKRY